jgi:D-3-phosphoglycerate dehydrogenase
MARILVCDNLADEGLRLLAEAGEVVVRPGLSEAELVALVGDYQALVVRSGTQITAPIIEAAKACRVIARAGVGVDNIDVPAATRQGILVVNSPAGNIVAAAEHAVALLCAAARQIPQASASLKAGQWDRKTYQGRQLQGKTLGLVGLGHVGGEVARRGQGLGMRVVACDPYVSTERARALGAELVALDDLLAQSDFVSLHAVATTDTRHLIGVRELALMRSEAILINTARGTLVDEAALGAALREGRLGGVALDVFEHEPPDNLDLIGLPQVIATPHVGALTTEAQVGVAVDAARQVVEVLAGRPARWPVNVPPLTPEALAQLAPYLPLVEALGLLAKSLQPGQPERVELRYSSALESEHLAYLQATALATVLQDQAAGLVNAVNAPLLAEEMGLVVEQGPVESDRGYTHLLELRLTGSAEVRVAGAVLDRGQSRIVSVDGYELDLPPEGLALLIWRQAAGQPGFVGTVGTLLGQAGISISAIQVSRELQAGVGLMALTVQQPVPPEVLQQLAQDQDVVQTRLIHFARGEGRP